MAVSRLLLALAASAAGVVTAVSNSNSTTRYDIKTGYFPSRESSFLTFEFLRNFTAKGIATGTTAQLETSPFASFSLSPEIPLATLDYGAERAGNPTFEASTISASAQIEVKYTEHFDGLNHPFGDGPYTFSNQLSNSFRVETFNITSIGRVASPLIQGG
ncbi:RhaA is able to hydrolyze alpha-1 [Colletotrichum salicis]|uniref:RhaA is able to hydrolyze alpha-1 n=1 Tax=Colletotrichum salicis TaxID=1209931 RepID=A0A135TV10_9PEZI|nr:RhaA is able to hydrolyze alpha-1 [Colletotrichum salicis]